MLADLVERRKEQVATTRTGSESSGEDDDYNSSSDSSSDLGVVDASNVTSDGGEGNENDIIKSPSHGKGPIGTYKAYQENKRTNHRLQRGLMQWKPMRNLAFAKDEAKFAVRRIAKKGSLQGRRPDVETEIG